MTTVAENELMTRVEGDAPLGRLMRENSWIPFALSEHLVAGDAPTPVRLFGENFVAFRADDGRIGFFDELCPHRRASLLLARVEGNALRCIYHGWKVDVSGCVVEAPTQIQRHDRFCARVPVASFPVHEAGTVAWVWLGSDPTPSFPDLPFTRAGIHTRLDLSVMQCNWLQGLDGSVDSAHATFLHRTWLYAQAKVAGSRIDLALNESPRYECDETSYGMEAVALRPMADGRTYVRVSEFFFPLVVAVPTGRFERRNGSLFLLAPVDDTHHLLFFGTYGEAPQGTQKEMAAVRDDYEPNPHNFAELHGDHSNTWGQDRELMKAGHFSGFGRSLLEEDAVVQASMGSIVDRTKEHFSSSDVAVALARRMILDAIAAADRGELPPGSARARERAQVPDPIDAIVDAGVDWREAELVS
jgi:nitrite reductase/ring-hydroxylating ferredoxin subunit